MDKQEASYLENERVAAGGGKSGAKPKFGQKLKRHCARFWWAHLIVFIIVVLVIVLPIVFVGFPKLAQREVKKSIVSITQMSILNPALDSFDLDLTEVLMTESKYHPQLDAFNGSLYLDGSDVAYAVIEVPAVKAENGSESRIRQRVQIADVDEFTQYAKTVLHSEELTIILKGEGGLKQGSLPKTTVDYDKRMTMKGFNGLKDLSITEFNVLTGSLPDGSNANGTVSIPNPTVMTLALGNVTLALSVGGIPVGTSLLLDLVLRPGNNTVPMLATTNQTAIIGIIQQPQYDPTKLPITIIGNASVYNGENLLYYSKALQANELTTLLDVAKSLEDAGLGFVLGSNTTSES